MSALGRSFFFFFSSFFLPGWSRLTLERPCDASCLSDLLRTGLSQQLLCAVVGWELESESAAVAAPMVLGSDEQKKYNETTVRFCVMRTCGLDVWRPNALMFVAGWKTGSHHRCSFKACVGGGLLTQQWEAVICKLGVCVGRCGWGSRRGGEGEGWGRLDKNHDLHS